MKIHTRSRKSECDARMHARGVKDDRSDTRYVSEALEKSTGNKDLDAGLG